MQVKGAKALCSNTLPVLDTLLCGMFVFGAVLAVISNHTQKHLSTPHYTLMETIFVKKADLPPLTC